MKKILTRNSLPELTDICLNLFAELAKLLGSSPENEMKDNISEDRAGSLKTEQNLYGGFFSMKKYTILLYCIFALVFIFQACSAANKNLKCNLYVIDAVKKKNIYLPSSNANDIDVYLKSSPQWVKIPKLGNGKLNHKAAYDAAKSGKTVIASYNTGNEKNGHVALVDASKPMTFSKNYGAYVPYASGSVQGRKPELLPMSYQFSADKEPKMSYFMYKGNL
ncbi:MAG: hypothetical protein FWH43_08595 [Endomicrobia bacterium]|nr:hypothetical protein [Endomicrobiia bacterium]